MVCALAVRACSSRLDVVIVSPVSAVHVCTRDELPVSRTVLTWSRSEMFFKSAASNPRAFGQSLQSFAIMPVQRVLRYKLLLQELLKNTRDDHMDKPAVQAALEQVEEAAKYMNAAANVRARACSCPCAPLQAVH